MNISRKVLHINRPFTFTSVSFWKQKRGMDYCKSVDIQNTVVYSQPNHKCFDFPIEHNIISMTSDTLFEQNLYTC